MYFTVFIHHQHFEDGFALALSVGWNVWCQHDSDCPQAGLLFFLFPIRIMWFCLTLWFSETSLNCIYVQIFLYIHFWTLVVTGTYEDLGFSNAIIIYYFFVDIFLIFHFLFSKIARYIMKFWTVFSMNIIFSTFSIEYVL